MTPRLRLQPEAVGSGMTSQRVRDRLVERLRDGASNGQGIADERVLNVIRTLGMNVRSKHDDGRIGWPEHGPYDAIIVTAAAPTLVPALVEQLRPGGVLVAPVGGSGGQALVRLVRREDGGVDETRLAAVTFVPLLSGTID